MKKVLAIDIGYGSVKVIYGYEDGTIKNQFKFTSIVALIDKDEFIKDKRILDYKDKSYYVGEDALNFPHTCQYDIIDFNNLIYFAPLFLYKALQMIGEIPDVIVCGLSKAQLQYSLTFKEAIQKFTVNNEEFSFENVYILPQGAGSKLAIDTYGVDFPNKQQEFTGLSNYVGVDVGFNTVDIFLVTNGKTSPMYFRGIENEGVMKIAENVQKYIAEEFGKTVKLHEAKEILDEGFYKLRGTKYDLKEVVKVFTENYLKDLLKLIEDNFSDALDKSDYVFLSGGGSALLSDSEDKKIRTPKSNFEYYNAIGFFLYGLNKWFKIYLQFCFKYLYARLHF